MPPPPEQRAAGWGWTTPPSSNSNAKGCLIAAGVVLGLVILCGIIGSLGDKSKSGVTPQTYSSPQAAAATPTPSPSPLSPTEALAKAKQMSGESASRTELGQAVDMLSGIPKEAKEYKQAQSLLEPTRKRWARLAAEELVLGPKPENSAWDGSVRCVDKYLKRTLNDYDSSEYLE